MIKKIDIQTADGLCDAWIAQPGEQGTWPAVLFCMDAVGPRAALFEMAERLASRGYVVLLTNLFYRERHAPIVTGVDFPARAEDLPEIIHQIMPLVQRFDPSAAIKDMTTFIDTLNHQKTVREGRLGIFGYCMGGALALRAAAEFPERFAAVASFHAGGLVSDSPTSPHKLLDQIHAEIYVAHADEDPHMTAAQIAVFDEAMSAAKARHEVELYKGAHHHFTMADLPAYKKPDADRAFAKLVDLFDRNLKTRVPAPR